MVIDPDLALRGQTCFEPLASLTLTRGGGANPGHVTDPGSGM